MLQLWLCKDRKQNTERLLTQLCTQAGQGMQGQLLIVPEQFSHAAERALCRHGGAQIGLYAEVLSFSRLANRVFSTDGGIAERETDPVGRLMIMSLAVEQVRSRLKLYANSTAKPEFLLQLLATFDEFRGFCVNADRLREAARQLTGVLAVKAEEFALLMESFDAVCANMGQNPDSRLTRLCAALETSEFVNGKRFYFDGFTDFNGIEQQIIAQLINRGAQVSVNLHCDGLQAHTQQYDAARETAGALLATANAQNVQTELHCVEEIADGGALHYLREKLFGGQAQPFPEGQEQIAFLSAADRTAECAAAADEILRLVARGARWRDISIICPDYASYRPLLESLLHRCEIPAYFAGNRDILGHPMLHMLLAALDAAAGQMETEEVLTYLKSGFVPLARERCDRLENYCLLWKISGNRWNGPWKMNPYGLQKKPDEKNRLQQLNEDRERLIEPLLRLRRRLYAAVNTGQMVQAVYDFTQEIELTQTLTVFVERSSAEAKAQQAQEYAQIYGILSDFLEQIYGVLGQSVRTPEEFCRVFRTALSQCAVGTIPAGLDQVSVGSLMSQRRCDTDYVLILGAQEGSFPAAQSDVGLLTDSERTDLLRLGINVAPTAAGRLDRELTAIDSVLNAPNKRLYLSAVSGTEAYLLRRARELFPQAPVYTDDGTRIRYCRREYLAYLATKPQRGNAPQTELQHRARELASAGEYSFGSLSENAVKALYGEQLRLSSSRIDALAACRFSYFLQYGLHARERKSVEVDPQLYGVFVHDVLEYTARSVCLEGGFHRVSLERTLQIAETRMKQYVQQELAELWQSPRTEYLFQRNFAEVRAVVGELYRELSHSLFEPQWFELHFAHDGDLPAVRIVSEKTVALLEGFVDRADIWRHGDRIYVRVVDYKTGKKSFDYTKLMHGLSMQMLLYLFALERMGGKLLNAPLSPAGVLYFPARVERISVQNGTDEKTIQSKRQKSLQRSGMLLDDVTVLKAMEPKEAGSCLPYMADDEGGVSGELFSPEQLKQLESFVFRTVAELADVLYSGEITPNPYTCGASQNACLWCKYQTVCRESGKEQWLRKVSNAEEFWQRIEEAEKHG